MINKINFLSFFFQKLIIFSFVFLLSSTYSFFPAFVSEDEIYDDTGIILRDDGWSYASIAEALFLSEESIRR